MVSAVAMFHCIIKLKRAILKDIMGTNKQTNKSMLWSSNRFWTINKLCHLFNNIQKDLCCDMYCHHLVQFKTLSTTNHSSFDPQLMVSTQNLHQVAELSITCNYPPLKKINQQYKIQQNKPAHVTLCLYHEAQV